MRRLIIPLLSLSLLLLFAGNLPAQDPPHSTGGINGIWTKDSNKDVNCATSCHVPKAAQALGPSLTKEATNPELCIVCHLSGSLAAGNYPFTGSDQADQTNKTGTSHRWDRSMNEGVAPLNLVSNDPNNKYGLKTYETLDSSSVKSVHLQLGAVTCSTCHSQHLQSTNPWDPAGGLYKSTGATGGTNKTIIQTGAGWGTNQWKDFYVKIISGSSKGNIRLIKTNTAAPADTLEIYATLLSTDPNAKRLTFPAAIAATNTYTIMSPGNHFMRMENKAGEMCEYCHYYRTPDSQPAGISQTNVETCNPNSSDGNRCYKMSHPIRKNLTTDVANANQFVGAAPLEPLSVFDSNGAIYPQTNQPRYCENAGTCSNPTYTTKATCETNGGTWTPADDNLINNIVLDSNSRVGCMSCHGIHYKDSE